MAIQNPPAYLAGSSSHSAQLFRRAMASLLIQEGVVGATDLAVTQLGTPGMGVQLSTGAAWVSGGESTTQGWYYGLNDASGTLTRAVQASGAQSRNDLVVAYAYDSNEGAVPANYTPISVSDSGAAYGTTPTADTWGIGLIAGTPGAGDPTVPPTAVTLARVVVGASASQITNANITDLRTRALTTSGPRSSVAASRPALPMAGMLNYDTDTAIEMLYDGTVWKSLLRTLLRTGNVKLIRSTGDTGLAQSGPTTQLGTATSVTTRNTNALWFVVAVFDFKVLSTGNQNMIGELVVDGATQSGQALLLDHGNSTRGTAPNVWLGTAATAASHAFSLTVRRDGTSGGSVATGTHTAYLLVVID